MIRHLAKISINKNGIALVTTLLIIALLVAVVVEFNRIAIAEADVTKNFGDEKKILYATISAVDVIRELLRLEGIYSRSDTLLDTWSRSGMYFNSAGTMFDEGKVDGKITDEDGKIHVNSLVDDKGNFDQTHKAIWERLLSQTRFALTEQEMNTIIHGIKDWIDKDDEISGVYGAESTFYMGLGYLCANGPLNSLEDMLLISGISEDIFYGNQYREGIRPYFTVYGGRKINFNTAPIPVIMALSNDMTEDIALEIDAFRRDDANKSDLESKNWYRKIWPFATPLPESHLTASSNAFTVYLKGTLRESIKEVIAVITRSESAARIEYWKEV